MNKIILLLIALFLVSASGFASVYPRPVDQQQKTNSPVINIKIDLGDITNLSQCEVSALIDKSLELTISEMEVLQCSVTVSASFTVGFASFTVSVTVSGDCAEVRAEGCEIANQIIDDIKSYFKKHLN